jgi:uncharacterized protein with HEPN domain
MRSDTERLRDMLDAILAIDREIVWSVVEDNLPTLERLLRDWLGES